MPAHRMSMRKLKEVLRLKWVCGLSHRQISRAAGISVGAVSAYAARASAANLDWASVEPLADDELEAKLRLPADQNTQARRVELDYALVHRELRRANVTLQLLWEEYVEAHLGERTYRYTQFCQRYRDWAQTLKRSMRQQHRAGEKLFADFAGHTMPILDGRVALRFVRTCLSVYSAHRITRMPVRRIRRARTIGSAGLSAPWNSTEAPRARWSQ